MRKTVWVMLYLCGVGFPAYVLLLPSSELVDHVRFAFGIGIIAGLAMWSLATRHLPSKDKADVLGSRLAMGLCYALVAITFLILWAPVGILAVAMMAATHRTCTKLLWAEYDHSRKLDQMTLARRLSSAELNLGLCFFANIALSCFINSAYMWSTNFAVCMGVGVLFCFMALFPAQRIEVLDPGGRIRDQMRS